jgi:uncharacterized protein (UPF0332 family)
MGLEGATLTTWETMGLECLHAAEHLFIEGYFRRSASSSYYAAYCAVTSDLVNRRLTFAHRWNNPSHEQLSHLILNNAAWTVSRRRNINRLLRLLRQVREDADYRPGITVDRASALFSLRAATDVLGILEIHDE